MMPVRKDNLVTVPEESSAAVPEDSSATALKAALVAKAELEATADDVLKAALTAPAKYLFVVSDGSGFVGAFTSLALAQSFVITKYALIPFVVQRFDAAIHLPVDRVWMLPYSDSDAVAFVSNDRSAVEAAQKMFASIGIVNTDNIDYWEHDTNALVASAAERLDAQLSAQKMLAPDALASAISQLEHADREHLALINDERQDGPLARAIYENKELTIFDCVVAAKPISTAESAAEPGVESAAESAADSAAESAAEPAA